MPLSLSFLGAAGTVTGSKFLLESPKGKLLIDCGLFQGLKELRLLNRAPFRVPPSSINAVVLTHAHLDHCGYLPLLVKQGYRGPVFSTAPTRDLAKLILLDSAKLQEEDADYANRKGYSKHHPAEPLYTEEDVELAMRLFVPLPEDSWNEIGSGFEIRLKRNGHILGSTTVEVQAEGKRVVFSGDLGRADPLTLDPPCRLTEADYLVVESTYGDRLHPTDSPYNQLAQVVADTAKKGGHLLIPSFAVGRTQDLLFLLSQLKAEGLLHGLPVYLDTPLGTAATEVFVENPGSHRLTETQIKAMQAIAQLVRTTVQSREIRESEGPAIVIAGSGMVSGGRILHHLQTRVGDPRNTVLLVGFQPSGTRGRHLKEGAAELKLFGSYYPVRAEVRDLTGLSAHADQRETIAWLQGFKEGRAPRKTFIVHGEPHSADALRVRIQDALGWDCEVARPFQVAELD